MNTPDANDDIPWAKALLFGSTFWMVLIVLALGAPLLAEQLRRYIGPLLFGVGFATVGVACWRISVWRRRRFNPYRGLGTAHEHIRTRYDARDHDHG